MSGAIALSGCRLCDRDVQATTLAELTADSMPAPANLGPRPVFGWKMKTDRSGAAQSAYRIRVFDGGKTVWDSGEVVSDRSVGIPYAGSALKSARRYRWQVSIKDDTGTWLAPAECSFETGLLAGKDWDGSEWISSADARIRKEKTPGGKQEAEDGTDCFVKTVPNGKTVREAFWTVAGLGAFDAFVNGEPVSHKRICQKDGSVRLVREFLKPGFTHCAKTKYAFTYDVTHLMKTGAHDVNVFSAQVSAGWWRDKIVNFHGKKSAFRAQLVLRFTDGSERTVGTDSSWLAAVAGPVKQAAIFDGESFDARVSTGWMRTGTPTPAFKPAVINTEYTGDLLPMRGASVSLREDLALSPCELYVFDGVEGADKDNYGRIKKCRSYRDGETIRLAKGETLLVDFGQNAAAVPSFVFSAKEGTTLTALPAEMLNDRNGAKNRGNDGPEGSVYRENLRKAKATLAYTFAGTGVETYTPSFTFFGYRYVSLTSTDGVTIQRIRSIPVTSIPKWSETGTLETGDPSVNKLISNVFWGQYSNYLSVPTDCPQRNERLGWTADTQVFCEAASYNANVYSFFLKWMRDMRDSQHEDGGFPGVAPTAQYGELNHQLGWGDAGIIVPYTMWKQFGDATIVEENWTAMMRYLKLLEEMKFMSPQASRHQWADWLSYEKLESCSGKAYEPNPSGKGRRPKADALTYWRYLGACYWLWDARMMATMAAATGKKADAERCRASESLALAHLRKNFVSASDGLLLPLFRDMQTPALFALKLGILTDEKAIKATKAALLKNIKDHGDCLQTGFLGTSILMDTLTYEAGAPDVAYTLLLQHKNPSWLYSVDQGATTIWERWNSYVMATGFGPVGMNSFNHYAYGAVVAWMYGTMAGIREDTSSPGFKHILLAPIPDKRIGHVTASFNSPYGVIKSAWRYTGEGKLSWTFTIPANTTATVILPGCDAAEYSSGTYTLVK
ncbi:MAG: family 78 glycoside hydrolase catalytic domain [Clostridia bacterium]|nr:family 78 glycoside hydrolase catalytic domain [Clostridia bacterium]